VAINFKINGGEVQLTQDYFQQRKGSVMGGYKMSSKKPEGGAFGGFSMTNKD